MTRPDPAAALPVGDPVAGAPARRPARSILAGERFSLVPVDADRDAAELYAGSHGDAEREALWTYLGYGPFASEGDMHAWLAERAASEDPLFFTVVEDATDRRAGVVSFLRIAPEMRTVELGHIWYLPPFQRGRANPDVVERMLACCFDELGYRRVEWKCDALNARSRRAAERLGFRFEGVFRQHLIVKGRNRDTAWYAMLDGEWERAGRRLPSPSKPGPEGSARREPPWA